jgi:hypothetical protein
LGPKWGVPSTKQSSSSASFDVLKPDTHALAETAPLRGGTDLTCKLEHVQHHFVTGKQLAVEVRELSGLCTPPAI